MKKVLLIFSSVFVLTSCDKKQEEDLFAKSPVERINETISELQKELVSSPDGWKLSYFPNEKKYGGFTFLMKFDQNGRVKMVSDFDQTTTSEKESSYSIKHGQGVLLSFLTKNHIHNLSDAILGKRGKGFEGEFEFIYLGKEDDKLKFRTQRTETFVYFEKASSTLYTEIVNYPEKIKEIEQQFYRYYGKITDNSGVKNYRLSISNRLITLRNIANADDVKSFAISPTSTGFKVTPSIKAEDNQEILELVWDVTHSKYVGTAGATTVELFFDAFPKGDFVKDDYQDFVGKNTLLVFLSNPLKNTNITSTPFKELIEVNSITDLPRVNIFFDANGTWEVNVNKNRKYLYITGANPGDLEYANKKVYLKNGVILSTDWAFWRADPTYNSVMKLLEFFKTAGERGFYVDNRTEEFPYATNPVYVLQSETPDGYYFPNYAIFR